MSEITLEITRVFDAPRELVFKAWTDGVMMKQWSCPEKFEITFGESDFRVGGRYRSTMKSEELGYEGTVAGEYLEIEEPSKLVMTHGWENDEGKVEVETLITLFFKDLEGKTEMNFVQSGFDSISSRDGHEEGWNSSFDKLNLFIKEII